MSYWDSYYRQSRVPWDPGSYDRHLAYVLEEFSIKPCRVVDVGCGDGKSLIWLAEQGFTGTGIDLSRVALRMAEKRARKRGIHCTWLPGSFPDDFSEKIIPSGSFSFAIERGCLQHMRYSRDFCKAFVRGVARILDRDAHWYSLTASRNGMGISTGPPRWTAEELVSLVEPYFEIRLLKESVFTAGETGSIPAWLCVMQKRDK